MNRLRDPAWWLSVTHMIIYCLILWAILIWLTGCGTRNGLGGYSVGNVTPHGTIIIYEAHNDQD